MTDEGEAVDGSAELDALVRDHLQAGETFRAAVWVSRADQRSPVRMTRAEMSPFRFRRVAPTGSGTGRGAPSTLAEGLGEHIRTVHEPRVLALTDRRVMVLAQPARSWRDIFRPAAGPRPALQVRWDRPRADLASAADQGGRLRLSFTDRSAITLLTPSAGLRSFLAG